MKLPDEMTLTDFFAAFALAGLLSHENGSDLISDGNEYAAYLAFEIGQEMVRRKLVVENPQ